ncbi:MAG TPA: peptidoglycan DD-metalloendopeptidase family protein [Longimicrobium sp.]
MEIVISTRRRIVRHLALPFLLAAAAACGDEPTRPVGLTLAVAPGTLTLHVLESGQLSARAARGGLPVTARVAWSSSDTSVARVSATGEVSGRAPGTARVTATGGGAASSITVTVVADLQPGELRQPFAGEFTNTNVFDHDVPRQFDPAAANGFVLSFWGQKLGDIDGHNGYDWWLPAGTPVLAAAPGVVTFAGTEAPAWCPLLNATTSGRWVVIAHGLAPHALIYTQYGHFSRIAVKEGDRVAAGQPLGLSGSSGCSTGPHLHFSVFRARADGHGVAVDPYGWRTAAPDPWAADTAGLPSENLWGAAPAMFREFRPAPPALPGAAAVISAVRYMGANDAVDPDGEFVEIVPGPGVAEADLGGAALVNGAGERFTFPADARVAAGAPLRVYSGAGTHSSTSLYWGRTSPAWNDNADCAVLLDAAGHRLYALSWGVACPASPLASRAVAAPAVPREVLSPSTRGLIHPFR